MTSEKMYEMIGDIDEKYVEGARKPMKKKMNYKVWGTMAACLCMVFVGVAMLQRFSTSKPNPEQVQVVSPILEVGSVEEMEKYLDYKVPVLERK